MNSPDVLDRTESAPARPVPAPSPKGRPRVGAALGAATAGLVVLFAFVSACYPADNSGLFLNLATGRAILAGHAPWGGDPFSYTATAAGWAPSWAFDVALHAIYTMPDVGPSAVVVFKAVLVAILAGFLIASGRRSGRPLAVPAACAALALLALSPRLALQPVVVSYLFLGVTLWLLRRGLEAGARPGRSLWLLPPLCLLWANCDEHFVLGPAVVALAMLGELLRPLRPGTAKRLGLVLVACLAACLLNPAHVHVFRLPWQLGLFPAADGLAQDRDFRLLFLSPLEGTYYRPGLGLNAAGLAWIPLALLGAASFAGIGRPRGWRLAVGVGFLLLAVVNYRSIAFFAVVAGPLLSLNLLDRLESRHSWGPRWLPAGGRLLGVTFAALLVALGISGWLQGQPARRQFGLGVRIDPSLREAALRLGAWRREGRLDPAGHVFPTTPDAACYLAWFAPEVKGFLDLRLHLFGESQEDFVTARSSLMEAPAQGERPEPAWRPVFRRRDVRQVLLHFRDARRPGPQAALARLLASAFGSSAGEWAVCHLDGRTAVATWNDPDAPHAGPAPPPLDLGRMAFGPGVRPVEGEATAPPAWRRWFADDPRSADADDAACFFTVYELLKPIWAGEQQQALRFALAASAVTSGNGAGLPGPGGQLLLHLSLAEGGRPSPLAQVRRRMGANYRAIQDAGPVPALYLGMRAARRALAGMPGDAGTHALLGQMVMELGDRSRESSLAPRMPQVRLLRQAQAAAALRAAVTLDPDREVAHSLLAELARSSVFLSGRQVGPEAGPLRPIINLEMEAEHRQEQLRCAREIGRRGAETEKEYDKRLASLDKEVNRLRQRVRSSIDEFEVSADRKPAAVRAEIALERGLVERALAELRKADGDGGDAASGNPARLVELLLATGRLDEAVALLRPEGLARLRGISTPLGLPAAEWFGVLVAASSGQYDLADTILERAQEAARRQPDASNLLAQGVGHVLLWEAPVAAGMPGQYLRRSPALLGLPPTALGFLGAILPDALADLQTRADLAALRGLLALEGGDVEASRRLFEEAASLGRNGSGGVLNLRSLPLSRLGLGRLAPR